MSFGHQRAAGRSFDASEQRSMRVRRVAASAVTAGGETAFTGTIEEATTARWRGGSSWWQSSTETGAWSGWPDRADLLPAPAPGA
jgi:hypothetical protein